MRGRSRRGSGGSPSGSRSARGGVPATVDLDTVVEVGHLREERDPELAAAIRALPPRRRLIVFLHYFADLPYRDIAEVLEISDGTVAASLAQARATLLESLAREEVR